MPIPGTKRVCYLEENLRAAEIALTDVKCGLLDELFPIGAARGERYGEGAGALIDR